MNPLITDGPPQTDEGWTLGRLIGSDFQVLYFVVIGYRFKKKILPVTLFKISSFQS